MTLDDLIEKMNILDTNRFVRIDHVEPCPKVPAELVLLSREITLGIKEPKVKAYAIHNWIDENISYNRVANENFNDKSPVFYTLKKKAGTCYSMTRLYIVLAKSAGLDARIAKVIVDRDGREIESPGHVCALVDFVNSNILIDPAYNDGDAKHKKVDYLSREETNQEIINDILIVYKTALKKLKKTDYRSQIECCDKVISIYPDNQYFKLKKQEILNTVGLKNIERGFVDNAITCFSEVLKIDPNNSYAIKNIELARSLVCG